MAMDDRGGVGSTSTRFPCGHENPPGNRFCDACGAWNRLCPLCESQNRPDAKFCSACGVRLEGGVTGARGVAGAPRATGAAGVSGASKAAGAPRPSGGAEAPRPARAVEVSTPSGVAGAPSTSVTAGAPRPSGAAPAELSSRSDKDGNRSWPAPRRDEASGAPIAPAFIDDFDDDDDSDERALRRRTSLPLVGIVVVTLAIVAGLAVLWPTVQCGVLGRGCDPNRASVANEPRPGGVRADPDSRAAPGDQSQPAPSGETGTPPSVAPPPGASTPRAKAAGSAPPANAPPADEPTTAGERGAGRPGTAEALRSENVPSSSKAPATASTPPPAVAPPAATGRSAASTSERVELPPRAMPRARENASAERASRRADRALRAEAPPEAPLGVNSEERMARFLLETVGPRDAEARALANATWYEPDRAERKYWERVADLVRRRRGQ